MRFYLLNYVVVKQGDSDFCLYSYQAPLLFIRIEICQGFQIRYELECAEENVSVIFTCYFLV